MTQAPDGGHRLVDTYEPPSFSGTPRSGGGREEAGFKYFWIPEHPHFYLEIGHLLLPRSQSPAFEPAHQDFASGFA